MLSSINQPSIPVADPPQSLNFQDTKMIALVETLKKLAIWQPLVRSPSFAADVFLQLFWANGHLNLLNECRMISLKEDDVDNSSKHDNSMHECSSMLDFMIVRSFGESIRQLLLTFRDQSLGLMKSSGGRAAIVTAQLSQFAMVRQMVNN